MVWASGGGCWGSGVTRLSGWDRAYQKEARPATHMSIKLNTLTSPMSADFGTCATHQGEQLGNYEEL
eukprot:6742098-Prymnesium_polylepis.1